MTVNITNLTNVDTFSEGARVAGEQSGGLLWMMVLIALFVVAVFNLIKRYDYDDAVLSAAFITFVVSLVFYNLDFVQLVFPIIFGAIIAGTIAYKKFTS